MSQNNAENELKARAENLWQQILDTADPSKKELLRAQYRKTVEAYHRQQLISDTSPENEQRSLKKPRVTQIANQSSSQNKTSRPSPYYYHDYREFLLDWIKFLKNDTGESVKDFAVRIGFSLRDLIRVLKRWQKLSAEDFKKILSQLELSATESSFLEALQCLADTDSPAIRVASLKRLQSFSEYQKNHPKDYETWRYLSHWYYVAIRELSTLAGFKADANWIQGQLRFEVPLPEIRRALEFLESAEFFKITPEGKVEPKLKQVSCKGGIYRLALGQFHQEILEIGAKGINAIPSDKRYLVGQTFAISKENYDQLRSIFDECLEKIRTIDPSDKCTDDVYHVEFLAFPLTRGSETQKE